MRFLALILGLLMFLVTPVRAQDQMWLQVEAQPDLATAVDRAHAYASLFPDVQGYVLASGWYGIALGPQTRAEAEARLLDLRAQNLIPADSYLSDGGNFGAPFWPVDGQMEGQALETPEVALEAPLLSSGESLEDSRAAEAALGDDQRMALQEALKWYGFYDGAVDGAFGKGTRASISAWQTAQGFEATGVLSTAQTRQLTEGFAADKAEFGFETVSEAEAGIEITLPLALVTFDRYEPPFVHYSAKDGSGVTLLLISEPGGTSALSALYDVIQTLELVPTGGERALEEDRFTIRASDDKIETLVHAEVQSGNVKGYLISWDLKNSDRMTRVLPALQASFHSMGDQVLDPGLVPLSEAVRRGLLAGLDLRHPIRSRTGFFIDDAGRVLTTDEAVKGCGKVVIERATEAKVVQSDPALGLTVLEPVSPLSPGAVAQFATTAPKPGARVRLSGYSYEDKLSAPVVTPGIVEELKGLNGEAGLTRLTLPALVGDQGGPVLDDRGAVLGMLVPVDAKGKILPDGVAFAASAQALTSSLTALGVTLPLAEGTGDQPTPDALAAQARGMTVLVSCWE